MNEISEIQSKITQLEIQRKNLLNLEKNNLNEEEKDRLNVRITNVTLELFKQHRNLWIVKNQNNQKFK